MFSVDARSKRLLEPSTQIAFHAVLDQVHKTGLAKGDTLVFNNVKLNLGDGYHSNHGIFIAPKPGLYVFSASVTSYPSADSHVFTAVIVKNGTPLAGLIGNGGSKDIVSDQGSGTVTMLLETNDEVWVKLTYPENIEIRGGTLSSFTGFLL